MKDINRKQSLLKQNAFRLIDNINFPKPARDFQVGNATTN